MPDWVAAEAETLGIRFVTLVSQESAAVAEQLAAVRAKGYLLNWPEHGPYVSGTLADAAAGSLTIVTYMGQSPDPWFYTDNMDLTALHERGILTTTTPDPGQSPVAECAVAFLLALELNLVPANAARKAGTPYPTPTSRKGLSGSVLGIVGMGYIGRRVAELAAACGMRITYFSRSRHPEVEQTLGATFAGLPELFAGADYVSLHLPGSALGLIDADVLSHANGIGLINTTSLGRVVDPEALLHALEQGWVRKVALEGRYAEPYDQRLRSFGDDRVLLMPPYTSYETPRSTRVGWQSYLASLTALLNGDRVPYQIGGAGSSAT